MWRLFAGIKPKGLARTHHFKANAIAKLGQFHQAKAAFFQKKALTSSRRGLAFHAAALQKHKLAALLGG
jgi:hypothetical protein